MSKAKQSSSSTSRAMARCSFYPRRRDKIVQTDAVVEVTDIDVSPHSAPITASQLYPRGRFRSWRRRSRCLTAFAPRDAFLVSCASTFPGDASARIGFAGLFTVP